MNGGRSYIHKKRQLRSIVEPLNSLRNVILRRAVSESASDITEAFSTGEDRSDYGEKGFGFRPVHVQ
jgi:hypothetical protein